MEPVVDNQLAQNVSAKDKINVRSLFSTSSRKRPNNSSSERQRSPSLGSEKSSKETARVEQLKAKYLLSDDLLQHQVRLVLTNFWPHLLALATNLLFC